MQQQRKKFDISLPPPVVFDGLEPTINIAHRGGAGVYPENTLLSFAAAVSKFNCPVIETDVHILADGEVVLFHDSSLERTTNGHGPISAHRWDTVSLLDAGYHFAGGVDGPAPFRDQGLRIPRLVDALRAFPTTRFNIELKSANPLLVRAVADILRNENALERVCIGSEFDGVAERLFDALPEATHFFPRAALVSWVMGALNGRPQLPSKGYRVLDMPAHFHGVQLVTEELISYAHQFGYWVNVWTIDEPSEMRRLIDLGVDGIMTDRPDRLASVLNERERQLLRTSVRK